MRALIWARNLWFQGYVAVHSFIAGLAIGYRLTAEMAETYTPQQIKEEVDRVAMARFQEWYPGAYRRFYGRDPPEE